MPQIALPKGTRDVVVAANGLFVVGTHTSIVAIDARGNHLWSQSSPFDYEPAASSVANALLEHTDGGGLRVTDLSTGAERQKIGGGRVYGLSGRSVTSIDPEASPLIVGEADGVTELIDVRPGRPRFALGRGRFSFGIAEGAHFAAWVDERGDVTLLDVERGRSRVVGRVDAEPATRVLVSRDGALVGVVVGAAPRGRVTHILVNGRDELRLPSACMRVSDDAGVARTATCEDGTWFDLSSPAALTRIAVEVPAPAEEVVFDEHGPHSFVARCKGARGLATLGPPGARGKALWAGVDEWRPLGAGAVAVGPAEIQVWDVETARVRGRVVATTASDFLYALSGKQTLLAVAKQNDVAVDVYRVADGTRLRRVEFQAPVAAVGFRGELELIVATSDGTRGCCKSEQPRRPAVRPEGVGVTFLDAKSGRVLRNVAGDGFVQDATGTTIGVITPQRVTILEPRSSKTTGVFVGPGRITEMSSSGRFVVVESVDEASGQVMTRVVELPAGTERLAVSGGGGVAFAPMDAKVAITPIVAGESHAASLVVYDLATRRRDDIPLDEPGEAPFFVGAATVGYQTRAGFAFIRLADHRVLSVRGFERDGVCRLYAATPDGSFSGAAEGGLGIRLGSDLGESELLLSGARFEQHRSEALVASFFGGR